MAWEQAPDSHDAKYITLHLIFHYFLSNKFLKCYLLKILFVIIFSFVIKMDF